MKGSRKTETRTAHAVGVAMAAAATLLLMATGGRAAHAQTTPQFFFTLQGQTPASFNQALTSLTVAAGQQFTLSVWYQFQPSPSVEYFTLNTFVGFDQTASAGAGATALNNRITLGAGLNADTAITNINDGTNPSDGHNPGGYTKLGANQIGGGQDPDGTPDALRPFGVDMALLTGDTPGFFYTGTGPAPVRLFDITLQNTGIGAGNSEVITLYSTGNGAGGAGSDFNTYLDTGEGRILGNSMDLTVFQAVAIPEAGSLPLVLCGGLSVGTLAAVRRRRARRS